MKTSHDSETLAEGKQVFTACAFIHHDFNGTKKLFFPKRALTKKFLPGVYELPGGHVDFGEEMVEGLKREIKEEFNMNIEVGDPFACFTYTNPIKKSHSIEVIYFARFTDPIDNIKLDPSDHESFMWLAEDDLSLATTEKKNQDDLEFIAIKKGFALLKGESPRF